MNMNEFLREADASRRALLGTVEPLRLVGETDGHEFLPELCELLRLALDERAGRYGDARERLVAQMRAEKAERGKKVEGAETDAEE